METFSCLLRVSYGSGGEKLCNCSVCLSCMDCARRPEIVLVREG